MGPTEILKREHRVIEQVLACLEKMAEAGSRDGRIEAEPAREAIEFFRNFADRCHHAKEEDRLFPLMESRGFSSDLGPTAVMRHEHETGRALIKRMADAVDGAAEGRGESVRTFVESATDYIGMLREHIQKEDHCLFPMADQALTGDDQEELRRSFERVEREEVGEEAHRRYLGLADALADRYGVARVAQPKSQDR